MHILNLENNSNWKKMIKNHFNYGLEPNLIYLHELPDTENTFKYLSLAVKYGIPNVCSELAARHARKDTKRIIYYFYI